MALKPYVEAIVASKEQRNADLAPARAEEQKGRLGLEIATLKVEIAGQENKVSELCGQYPIDVEAVLDAQDDLDLNKRRLQLLTNLVDELFPTKS